MTITRIHGSSIATLWLQILSNYANLSDDSDFSPRNFPNSSRGNGNFLGRKEKILRKNQLKLRKNEMISRKNFSVPRWRIKNLHGTIEGFPL